MTKQRFYYARCPACGQYPVICQVCGSPATGSTPFSDWLRSAQCPEELSSRFFDCQNLDYIWFNYREGWLITLEEKQFGKSITANQSDTHRIIQQLLETGAKNGVPVQTMRGKRKIEYRGHYLVVFSRTMPDDSEWIKINGKVCGKNDLLHLLRFGTLPSLKWQSKKTAVTYSPAQGFF